MCVSNFSRAIAWNFFDSMKNWARYNKNCVLVFREEQPFYCLILMESNFLDRFSKSTQIGGRLVHETATSRCDDTRGCVMQFWPPDDEAHVLETCRGMK